MTKAWLFTVEIAGFPRDDAPDPIEVHGGHSERWAVLADDQDRAAALVAGKVYDTFRFERALTPEEASALDLIMHVPRSLDGFRHAGQRNEPRGDPAKS